MEILTKIKLKQPCLVKGHTFAKWFQQEITMQRSAQKPWQYYFVMVFPNSAKIMHDELKSMVETTHKIQEREINYLIGIAAKHPRNNIPKPVNPFIAVFMTFLRRTNALSLLLLLALVGAVVYVKTASGYSIFLNAPVLIVFSLLVIIVGITPYLGWKGAKNKNWAYLRYYDSAIICFLALLALNVCGLEYFQANVGNALDLQQNHLFKIYGNPLLFSNQTTGQSRPVTSFLQAEVFKSFVNFLQARFEELFPKNELAGSTHRRLSSDIGAWFSQTFNVTAVFYPPPITETPEWMKTFVSTTCTDQPVVNGTFLTGNVEVIMEPTFQRCLRPILETCVYAASYTESVLVILAALLIIQYLSLLVLKYIDPAAAEPRKKSLRKTSSIMHFFDAVLFTLGVISIASGGYGIYNAVTRGEGKVLDTEMRVVEISSIVVAIVYGHLLCLSALLGCSQKLIPMQTYVLTGVLILQFALAVLMYNVKVDVEELASKSFQDQTWDESLVLLGINHVFTRIESATSEFVVDFVNHECQINVRSTKLTEQCRATLAIRITELLRWVINAAGVVMAMQCILLVRNLITTVVMPCLRRLWKKKKTKRGQGIPTVQISNEPTTKEATLPFHAAMDKYWESFPRGFANDKNLAQARQQFTLEWLKVTGATRVHEKDQLLAVSQFESIVRVLVLKRLVNKCGLEVSVNISRDGKHLYFKLAAPRKVIADEAEARKYHLQCRKAVDPCPKFWTAREVAIENTVYDTQTAKQKLCALYGRQLLTVVENQFFPNESMAQVSRRINVHNREAMYRDEETAKKKKLPTPSRYAPYFQYFRKPSMQYLYQRHSTQLDLPTTDVAPSVFQVTGCLKLLHLVIHDEFDTARMISNGILDGFSCLHSASRFEWTNITSLSTSWLTYWRPRHLPDEPDPDKHYFINFFYRIYPFRQPLIAVRSYFGEQIALYFHWLGFYAQCLMFPVVCSIVYVIDGGSYHSYNVQITDGHVECELKDMFLGLAVLIWAFVYAKCWQRKNYMCAIAWGMHGIEENEKDRVDFYGKEQLNPITNEVERTFPDYLRLELQLTSLASMAAIAVASYFVMVMLFPLEKPLVQALGPFWGVTAMSIILVLHIQVNSLNVTRVAHWLNERENYQTQSQYERFMIMKLFALQSMNHFSALFFIAFFKRSSFGCYDTVSLEATSNCLPEMENLLLVIFGWRLVFNAFRIVVPLAQMVWSSAAPQRYDIEYELSLEPYENTYEDYAEIVVQFGLMTLFIFPCPIGPIFAFFESAINLRMDAYKLCYCSRRPLPQNAEDIGAWFIYLLFLSRFCIATNLGFLFFTASNFASYSAQERWTFYLLSTAAGLLIYEALWFVIPTTPDKAATILERHEFLRQKYLFAHDKSSSTAPPTSQKKPSCAAMLETLETYNADALETLNARLDLLNKFNELFVTKPTAPGDSDMIEMTVPATLEPTTLTGMDAIREAVRRSAGLFGSDDENDDDESGKIPQFLSKLDDRNALEWYFTPQPIPEAPPLSHVPTNTSTLHVTRGFVEDVEVEEALDDDYIIQDDDEDLADLL
ncbi:hypothetical protein Ae201684P_005731 [Aphanomyces euteiches]|uniref:Anoctamin transmembrane domain-containing protein n=1 Tax=Aphanomyces euteiches TaxID=100861 RepID=A0A6G0X4F0_9STRA|nr:hypothetical protein Ae201684_008734 [Aphanomyces euteiches]KAH9086035.1 hypothetical protein Ae201684P_005731 [Aphanomyces euteiches]